MQVFVVILPAKEIRWHVFLLLVHVDYDTACHRAPYFLRTSSSFEGIRKVVRSHGLLHLDFKETHFVASVCQIHYSAIK